MLPAVLVAAEAVELARFTPQATAPGGHRLAFLLSRSAVDSAVRWRVVADVSGSSSAFRIALAALDQNVPRAASSRVHSDG